MNGPYSSCRLKARLWGQNHRNLNNFCLSTDMTVAINRYALYAKEHLKTKFYLSRTLINRTGLINVCCHGYRFAMATMISATSIPITVSIYLVFT